MTSREPHLSGCEYMRINDRCILCCGPEGELGHLHHRLDWLSLTYALLFRPSLFVGNLDLPHLGNLILSSPSESPLVFNCCQKNGLGSST
jgi:hypothetical protein